MTRMEPPAAHRVKLGKATVDLEADLVLDAEGRPCSLRPQSFAVLRHLIARPGRLVTKDELMQAVWPGLAVTDDSLVQCIGEIRKALDDGGRTVVETVPRRGYRLALLPSAPTAPLRPDRGWAAWIGALALVAALALGAWQLSRDAAEPGHTPAVAVLPFVDTTGQGKTYLGDGVADDIISMLARSPDVLVMARGSSFAYGGAPRDVREIGRALGADYVLEGSVRPEGDKLRITAQLDDANSGQPVWAERFDRAGTDPWALVDEVTGLIINAMVGEGGQIKRAEFRKAWGKDSAQLGEYDYYLRGLDVYFDAETAEENDRGGRIWAEGLEHYPRSALLKMKMGWYHWTAAWDFWSGDLEAHFREADRLVTEVLATDNLSPEVQRGAHWLYAFVLLHRGAFDDAVREAEFTVAMAPYDARVLRHLTDVLAAAGHYDLALQWLDRAEPREPGRTERYEWTRGYIYRLMGRYADSVEAYRRGKSERPYQRLSMAISLLKLGRTEEAREQVRAVREEAPDFTQALWRKGSFYSDPAVLEGEVAALAELGLPAK